MPRWLEELLLAVGETELRRALETAVEAGELGDGVIHKAALQRILRGAPTAKRRKAA